MSGFARGRLEPGPPEPEPEADMTDANRDLVGWALIGCGVFDVVMGVYVLAPRMPEGRRRAVVTAMAASGGLMVSLGGCFLGRVF
jgi:hypothetical protein